MIACAGSDEQIGIVAPISNCIGGQQQDRNAKNQSIDEMLDYAEKIFQSHQNNWQEVDQVIGFCMLIKRKVIDKIGLCDEQFGIGNYQDNDLCLRARTTGF